MDHNKHWLQLTIVFMIPNMFGIISAVSLNGSRFIYIFWLDNISAKQNHLSKSYNLPDSKDSRIDVD